DLDTARRPVIRMTADADSPLTSNVFQNRFGRLVGADVLANVQRDNVRVLLASKMVPRHLDAWDDEQIVQPSRALRLRGNVGEVGTERVLGDRELLEAQGGEPAGAGQKIALHEDVIRDGDYIEASRRTVQIDHLAEWQPAVTPPGVDVKVAEKKRFVSGHQALTSL